MIYFLEDDANIQKLVCYALGKEGYEIKGLSLPSELWSEMRTQIPQLLLLDIMLPEEDGLSILGKLQADESTKNIPVIMITAKGSEFDKVTGLDMGADDYLVKPFGMMEMISHIKAVLRRASPKVSKSILSIGELSVNLDEHNVLSKGEKVVLTFKEFELLKIFMENPGRVFSRDALLEKVWGADYYGETRTVDVHIGTLRTKLGECGEYIETIRGVGYRMEERH